MTNEQLFPEIEVKTVDQTKFKTSIYFKPKQDFRINVPHEMHIIRATETSSLFLLPGQFKDDKVKGCSSYDRVTGYDKVKKEKVNCEECPYRNRKDHQGFTISEGGKEIVYKCSNNYSIFMEHPDADKEYVLGNVNWKVYIEFSKYRQMLLTKGLDVNQVITKVTRVEPLEGNGYMYEFEFVSELNLDVTTEEQDLLDTIKSRLTEPMAIADVTDVLVAFGAEMDIDIDNSRARRLVESIAKDGMVYPGK